MGNYICRKHENACNIFKNSVYDTVCPPGCILLDHEGIESFCRTDVKRTDTAVI